MPRENRGAGPPARSKRVPVIEETAEVGTRRVETGRVVVEKRVEEHVENVEVPVAREEVEIRRVPVNRPVETRPEVRRSGDTVIVPVVEEQVVVTRQLVLKEEIHLITHRSTEKRSQPVTLRRERAEVKRSGGTGR